MFFFLFTISNERQLQSIRISSRCNYLKAAISEWTNPGQDRKVLSICRNTTKRLSAAIQVDSTDRLLRIINQWKLNQALIGHFK